METIQLAYRYTQDEYVKAERQYLIANKTIRKYDLVISALFLILSTYYLFLSSFSIESVIMLGLVLLATSLGILVYYVMPILRFKQLAKYHEENILVFSKDIIRWKTSKIESELKWDIYSELWESKEFYYLIHGPRMYTIIPKRVFVAKEEKQVFEDMAFQNLKSIKRTL